MKPLVILESPLAGDYDANIAYAKQCLADSLKRGEAPYASHLLYPGVLDDKVPEQRLLGMRAGFAWGSVADFVAVYTDRGITAGMWDGIRRAMDAGQGIELRTLDGRPVSDEYVLALAEVRRLG